MCNLQCILLYVLYMNWMKFFPSKCFCYFFIDMNLMQVRSVIFPLGHDGYVILWDLRIGEKIVSFYNSVSTKIYHCITPDIIISSFQF